MSWSVGKTTCCEPSRLLKNTHLLRYTHPSSLQRTRMYASFLRISRALHLVVFEQPAENYFFNNLLDEVGKYPVLVKHLQADGDQHETAGHFGITAQMGG